MSESAIQYARDNEKNSLNELIELLSIPSISTLPNHASDVLKAADWLSTKLDDIGMENIQLLETPRHPVLYADWLHAEDKPTLLIYGHYDVQPVDPVDEWDTPPFEPTVRDENLYARGSSDDKGQVMVHVRALESILKTEGALPINVKLLLEGEEEIGSENLQPVLESNRELFKADFCAISDSAMLTPTQPLIVYGLRGMSYTEVELTGPSHDLHSGAYGGAVHNPMQALCEIIAKLHDENGTVTIPGFYDKVRTMSEEEKDLQASIPFGEQEVLNETGVPKVWGESEYSVPERLGVRPTLEVHGIRGGFTGDGAKTVIPAKALAKISMRLVPNQNSEEAGRQLADYVKQISPETVNVEVRVIHGGEPALVDYKHPAIVAAGNAFETSFGNQPFYTLEGGSIPVVELLQRLFDIPVVLMGFGLPDDRLHSPNEKYHLPNYYKGIECCIHYMQELAKA
jgi:acetylornithine deacetylase/succinyl-diaminopimelate desuccinylase-like protein